MALDNRSIAGSGVDSSHVRPARRLSSWLGGAARHVGYGVQTHHYRAVGEALIGALAAHLDAEWDDALEAAWRRAYNLVAEVMMAVSADIRAGAVAGRPSGHRDPAG